MFYSSDPKRSGHDNYLAPSNQDKYSSIRALDQTHNSIRHSVSETSIFAKFSSKFKNEPQTESKPRPYSTIEFHGETVTSSDERKAKSFSLNRQSKSTDPFADILHSVRQSVKTSMNANSKGTLSPTEAGFCSKGTLMAINSKPSSPMNVAPDIELAVTDVTCLEAQANISSPQSNTEPVVSDMNCSAAHTDISSPQSSTEPVVSDMNCSAARTDISSPQSSTEPVVSDMKCVAAQADIPSPSNIELADADNKVELTTLRSESRVSSPRYHALSEDELEEELLEENEVRSRQDSVVLCHEIIKSYSITENCAQKTTKADVRMLELDETDSRKGYVQLRYDTSGMVSEDDFDEQSILDNKLSKDVHAAAPGNEKHSLFAEDVAPNNSSSSHDSLPKCHQNILLHKTSVSEHKILSTNEENASKRLTVDVGELRRQSDCSRPIPSRPKHISITGGTVREIKFLRSPPSRVSTLFSTKIPEVRSSDKNKGGQKGKQLLEPGFVFFGDGLFDFTEERNEEAVAFSTVLGELRSKLCGKLDLNLGYLLSPTVTQNSNSLKETFEEVPLSLEIFIEGQDLPVLVNCSSKTHVSEVIAEVLQTVWKQNVNPSSIIDSAFTLKICGFQEYLSSLKLLCEYEYVHQCVMARRNVRFALLDSDNVPRTLARSEMDDIADCEPRIYSQFFDRPLDTSVSREGLSVLREAFEDELRRMLQDADSPNPRFQPGRLVQSVRAVCTTLGQIETKGIVNYVFSLHQMKRKYDEACQGTPTHVSVDMVELRSVLHNLYKHVYLLIELYCNTFNTDFGRIRISEKIINGSIEVTAMTDKFSVYIPAAYRIPPEWKEKFETYVVEGKIYYGGKLLSVPECTAVLGEIRTNFFPQISWQCWMTFGVEIRKLPRESKLCFTLYGVSPVAKNGTMPAARTPLGWTAVQLFDFNGVLVSGSQLFGLWPNQAANPLGTCTSNLIDKRSAILQVDFARHLADIVFPALEIPEADTAVPEVVATDIFNKLLSKDLFEDLRPDEIHMIWQSRWLASKVPGMLPLVLSSVPDWTHQNLPEIYQLLANWTPMSPVDAMELLKVQFPDQMVRAIAVQWMECFSDDELCDYLPQLVQALKYESYHNSPLARFLIERALRSSRLIHYLFWHLKDNIADPQFGQRYQVILGGLLSVCGSLQRDQFTKQDELVTRLTDVAEKVKKSKENVRDELLRDELEKIPGEILESLRLPLNPGVEVTAILADECSYFNSNSVPLRLLFENSDMHGFKIDTMYKVGDDLRQDALTMQLIGIMNKLWLKEGLDLKMVTYRCLPTGSEMGMVELVQDAQTLREIQTEYGLAGSFKDEPLARWLLKHNPIEKEYGEAVNNFISSCAGYCVATYVIGICDRHNDNIMVKKTGHLFHIDFSKFLGRSQMFGSFRRDRSPFVLTSDMAYVINGGCTPTSRFQDFVDLCCRAFNIIRHHTNLFLNLLSLMLNSGIPYLSQTNDLKYVYDVLLPQATDLEATTIFTRQIESSLASRFTQVNFFIHNMAQIRHSSQMKDDDSVMPVLSFSPHTYSIVIDGKITSARVVDYQKRYTPEKYYIYLINVCREDQSKPTFVFRRYSHFHEFNAKLADQFPHQTLPKLPGKIYLGRSQIRMVAEKRRQDFDHYLQELLCLKDINSSTLLYTFLHSLPCDDLDVKKYAIRLLPEERYPRDRPMGGEVKVFQSVK